MKQKHISFNMQVGLWLSAAAILLASASSPFSSQFSVAGKDAMPITPPGWSDPIVLAKTAGTNASEVLEVGSDVYIDMAVLNNGNTNITETFSACLYFDVTTLVHCWSFAGLSSGSTSTNVDYVMTYAAVPAQEGSHSLQLRIDEAHAIASEADTTNNTFTADFTWVESTPSTAAGTLMADALTVAGSDKPADVNGNSNLADMRDLNTYMIGKVAVSVILPESDGISSSENWSQTEIDQVKAEVQAGLDNWKTWYTASSGGNPSLDFVIEWHTNADAIPVAVPDDPISFANGTDDQDVWINQAFDDLSVPSDPGNNPIKRAYAYDNTIRTANSANWAFTIFVVDSSSDLDGKFNAGATFPSGSFAYSYLNGPFLVMTYDNANWGISQMNEVLAHQVAHIFGAADQYPAGCSGTSATFGYLDIANSNCGGGVTTSSLMYAGKGSPDTTTRQQVGWRQSDADQIFDPADTRPVITGFVDETPTFTGTNHLFSGTAYDNPWPNATRSITIRKLIAIEYRVDGGAWQNADITTGALDSDREDFSFATPNNLGGGTHIVDVRARNNSTDPVSQYSLVGVGQEGISRITMTFSNDNFASAQIISSLPYTSTGINTTTFNGGGNNPEPQDLDMLNCGGDPNVNRVAGDHSAWYRYTPTTTESVTLDTLGSDFDTMIGVYLDIGFNDISQIGCDDDSLPNLKSVLTVALSAGKTYYFVVSSFNGAIFGKDVAPNFVKPGVSAFAGGNDPGGNLVLHVTSNGEIVVSEQPAVISSVRVDPNPTALNTVRFTVTFSESVTGVDVNDFSLTTNGSGVGNAAVTAVSPTSGYQPVYTVSVSTGVGNGIIRLDVINNNTILDATFFPLVAEFTRGESYRIKRTPIFDDVPFAYWANDFVERLYYAGVTGGCSVVPLNYCPDSTVTRAQMAVFLLKATHGPSYSPPAIGASTGFTDVPVSYWAAAWIKQLAAEGITGGCGSGNYCPDATVTRAQMAVFLLKSKHGSTYTPPSATGVFTDVPIGYWADKWIEQLAVEGVTSGCGTGIYCPDSSVTRAQMAVFIVKAFSLP